MNLKIGAAVLSAGLFSASALAATNDSFKVTGYAAFDVSSGYILYGARMNDEPCLWSYGELTLGYGELGSLGISLWQNTDFTSRRSEALGRINEWDWTVFYRGGVDLSEDWRFQFELGHIWYKYHHIRPAYRATYATMEEWLGRFSLPNPYLTPYFEYYYDHQVTHGRFMQGGVKRTFEFADGFLFTPDLTFGGGDRNYNACLYPPYDCSVKSGPTFVQLASTIAYYFNAHFGIHARIAYVVLVNDDIRTAVDKDGGTLANDFVWGSVGMDFAF